MEKKLKRWFDSWIVWKGAREDQFYTAHAKETYSLELVRKKLTEKKYTKPNGPLKILAVFMPTNWEGENLPPALRSFGTLIHDPMDGVRPYSLMWQFFKKGAYNRAFVKNVTRAVKEDGVNVIFMYVSGLTHTVKTIREIEKLGVPTINLALDDYLKFKGYPTLTGWSGAKDLAKYFTINITSYKESCERYLYEGAIPLYLPEGGNSDVYKPMPGVSRDIDVAFVGKNYGMREEIVRFLKDNGVKIEVMGRGWPSGGVPLEKMIETYSRAKIAIGFSDSRGSGHYDLPGRDFEVPLMGPMYLTEWNPKIGEWYDVGKELVLYKDRQDLLEKIRYYLSHEDERAAIAIRGRDRALQEHTWEKRFAFIFKLLGILQ